MHKTKRIFMIMCTVILTVVILISLWVWRTTPTSLGPGLTLNGSELRGTAPITGTSCPPRPDIGCSITVGGYDIAIVHGNINTPNLGTVSGQGDYTGLVGRTATIFAHRLDSHTATIFDSANYYVHIK